MASLASWRLALAAAGLVLAAGVFGCSRPAPAVGAIESPLSVAGLLSDAPGAGRAGGDEGGDYARALVPRPFVFPDDDGPHPAFRSEWWYFTGVLRAGGAGRRFGYEMTIFRQALARERPARPSAWATRDLFMAHFAITDADGRAGDRRFHAYERFARDGLGLAGAGARPFAVWVDDWRMQGPPSGAASGTTDGANALPIHLTVRADDGGALDLTVGLAKGASAGGGGKGPIPEGDHGLAAKGPAPGNASFYYSRTALPTSGRLTLPAPSAGSGAGVGTSFEVTGDSWMDREWGTGALGAGVRGWDWLGVHLSDGRDLVLYRLRDAEGRATPQSRVTLVAADGGTRSFGPDGFTLTPLDIWVSPRSGARYPVSFRLEIPGQDLRALVRPLLVDQELQLAVRYWEGAASLEGTLGGEPIAGEGYLELTGYGGGQRQR